ncbi:MAG: alpha/beta fold hydrolase [Minicystis sp.]
MAQDRDGSDDPSADRYADRVDKLSDDRRRLLEALLADREPRPHPRARIEAVAEPPRAGAARAAATNGHAANGHAHNGHAANGHEHNGHATNGHAHNGHAHNGHTQNGNARRVPGNRPPPPRNPFAGHGAPFVGAQTNGNPFGDHGNPFGGLGGGVVGGLLQHVLGRITSGVGAAGLSDAGGFPWSASAHNHAARPGGPVKNPWAHGTHGENRAPRPGGPVKNPWSHGARDAHRAPFGGSSRDYDGHDAPAFSPLVAMKPTGSRTPFFCVHALLGSAFPYHHLAVHVDRDQPMYGLQARGLDGAHEPLTRVEDMAACYLEAVRVAQPKGPYHIGGYSFGGWIAFEMARLLRAEGEEIASLTMFGTLAPSVAVRGAIAPYAEMVLGYLEDFQRLVTRSSLGGRGGSLNPQQRVVLANCMAALRYLPRPEAVGLDLFVTADQRLLCQIDPSLGWGALCEGPIETYAVPGNHLSMFQEPHVRELAAQLAACLSRGEGQ